MADVAGRLGRLLTEKASRPATATLGQDDRLLLRAQLLQHARLQFEADELAADVAFLSACRVMVARGGSERLRALQLAAALRVMQDADVVVTTLVGAASLSTLRLHPVLEVR